MILSSKVEIGHPPKQKVKRHDISVTWKIPITSLIKEVYECVKHAFSEINTSVECENI